MWKTLSLIVPVLVPSWRFFKAIEPSPKVQWSLLSASDDLAVDWHQFRPRPARLSPLETACRLVWNPAWNEALFLVSCAERIAQEPAHHSIREIRHRITREIKRMQIDLTGKRLQFRLVFVHRGDQGMSEEVVFLSDAIPASDGDTR